MRLSSNRGSYRVVVTVGAACALFVPALAGTAAAAGHTPKAMTLPSVVFVAKPPPGASQPDDITAIIVPGFDNGNPTIWTAYQNGINPDGTPGKPGGPTKSTVAVYDALSSKLVKTFKVKGKVDGLTADPVTGRVIATVNEDLNSAYNVINPVKGTVTPYTYVPSPAVGGAGGTDSIAVSPTGQVYVSHSNPKNTKQAADFSVKLDGSNHTAKLTGVFSDDATAVNGVTGKKVTLALTDPDTNGFMPAQSPRFAGDLATVSQGDGEVVFAAHPQSKPALTVLPLTDNVKGNKPPIDGLATEFAANGFLFVVDASAQTITVLSTAKVPVGTVFVSEPNDNKNPLIGTLNLKTGVITRLGNKSPDPKGILFVPPAPQR